MVKLKKSTDLASSKTLKRRMKKLKRKQKKADAKGSAEDNKNELNLLTNGTVDLGNKPAKLRKKKKKTAIGGQTEADAALQNGIGTEDHQSSKEVRKKLKISKKIKKRSRSKQPDEDDEGLYDDLDIDEDENAGTAKEGSKQAKSKKSHKEELEALAEKDPEFFEFLKSQEADLLDFNESDIDSDVEAELDDEEPVEAVDGEEPMDEDAEDDTETVAIGKRKLRIRKDTNNRKLVDMDMVNALEAVLTNPSSTRQTLAAATSLASKAFLACVARAGAAIEKPEYVVNSEKVFEGIVRLCFTHLGRCLMVLLDPAEKKPEKDENTDEKKKKKKKNRGPRTGLTFFKKWRKYSGLTKEYLTSVLNFLVELQHNDVICSALRAVVDLADLYTHFAKTSRQVVKTLVRIWSRKMERARALAFVALCKLVRLDPSIFSVVYKSCYVAYVSNSRTVTAETWPLILFMQKSFAELTFLDAAVAYQYAFVYVRQYAIHLRNAIIAKRKDLIQTVYNWQFMQGLYLWAAVLGKCSRRRDLPEPVEWLKELIYPLVQIVTGFMKVFPKSRYLPLRLHCIRLLLQLQVNCKVFIPTLALSVELLSDLSAIDEKKPSRGKGATRVVEMKEILKLSKEMLDDAGYRQRLAEELFQLTLEAAYVIRGSIAFPQIIVPVCEPIKAFTKTCRNPDHARLFKSLLAKIRQHADNTSLVVAAEAVDLKDYTKLEMLEQTLGSAETALAQFYKNWQHTFELKLKSIAEAEEKALQKVKEQDKRRGMGMQGGKRRFKKVVKKPK